LSVVYLGLGSNLGDRVSYLRAALDLLIASGEVAIRAVSSLYETAPMHIADQPAFLNGAVEVQTGLSPLALLHLLKETEQAVGRVQRVRYGPREVDLDILLYDDITVRNHELTIPHPRLAERAFALVPLKEIAPGLLLPGTGASLASLIPAALALGSVDLVQGPEWYGVGS
jgi:2-amino-4-hydroxy-6-hydroxymethyldihydropteridine diphosphokinase